MSKCIKPRCQPKCCCKKEKVKRKPREKKRCGVDGCDVVMAPSNQSQHRRIVHNQKFLKCPNCPLTFTRSTNLKLHISNKHSAVAPLFKCPECDKVYKYRSSLIKHKNQTHGGSRGVQFRCLICGKDFPYQYGLDRHLTSQIASHAGAIQQKIGPSQVSSVQPRKV